MVALGLPPPRVHYTGVDLARFAPTNRAAAQAALGVPGPLIVSAGTLDDNKGQAILIAAMTRLPGATLLIAGDGPNRPALEQQAAVLGERVRVIGAIPHADLAGLLAAADVFALASAREGLANVWVEALASGTPVVITDAGGAREVVTDPAYGRIVERTPEAFAAAITELLADPPAATAVRAGAQRFSWRENARQLRAHLAALV
jgi:teichuronic acid biosynthesis glycosyltransferase TuaC